jgi:6-phosphogluconolactonase
MGVPRTGVGLPVSLLLSLTLATMLTATGVARAQAQAPSTADAAGVYWVYVGTYTNSGGPERSRGIYLMEFDTRSGELGTPRLVAESPDPSFLAIHPSREFLYAVNESGEILGRRDGGVSAFAIDQSRGTLTLLNQQLPAGSGPCHLVVDRQGQNVLVANYGSGSVGCLPIDRDGRLRPATTTIQHRGPVADPRRQGGPHAHSVNLDAANRYAVVADLGLDEVLIYAFDPSRGRLTPHQPPFTKVAPRSGPRHFAFHPDGRFGYVINEISKTVTAFAYDSDNGILTEIQTIPTVPADSGARGSTAEVQVHPSGKFLYGSNRGHDSIAIFAIDPTTGKLTSLGFEPTRGKTPRNFAIDPTGAFLFAENQDSNSIVVFRIDPQAGTLKATGQTAKISRPVCIKMMPRPVGATR